tara:strand:- start:374 stop:565 length:192 start_codon:yes stop_codon:yes gene_type:complete
MFDTANNITRILAIHFLWLTGLHGAQSFSLMFDSQFLSNPYLAGLTHEQFLTFCGLRWQQLMP